MCKIKWIELKDFGEHFYTLQDARRKETEIWFEQN